MIPDIPGKSRHFQDDMSLLCVPFCCLMHEQYFSLNHSTQPSSVLALFFQPGFLCSPPSLLRCSLSSAPDFGATSEVFSEVVIVATDRPWWGSFRPGALKAIIICVLGQHQEMFLVLSCTEPKNVRRRLWRLTWLLVIFHYSYCFEKLLRFSTVCGGHRATLWSCLSPFVFPWASGIKVQYSSLSSKWLCPSKHLPGLLPSLCIQLKWVSLPVSYNWGHEEPSDSLGKGPLDWTTHLSPPCLINPRQAPTMISSFWDPLPLYKISPLFSLKLPPRVL